MINTSVFTDRLRDCLSVHPAVLPITIHTVNNIHMVSKVTLYCVSKIQPNDYRGSALLCRQLSQDQSTDPCANPRSLSDADSDPTNAPASVWILLIRLKRSMGQRSEGRSLFCRYTNHSANGRDGRVSLGQGQSCGVYLLVTVRRKHQHMRDDTDWLM